jgi:hypothetical protein
VLTARLGHEAAVRPPQDVPRHVDDDPWPVEAVGPVIMRAGLQQVNALAPLTRA